MPADPDFAALAARAEGATGCKLGEVRPTATGCGWQRPADLFISNAEANRRAAEEFAANPFVAWLRALAAKDSTDAAH